MSELHVAGEAAPAGGAEWVPGLVGVQSVTFRVDQPRGVHEIRLVTPAGDSLPASLPVRADDEPVLAGIITTAEDRRKRTPRAYHITITDNHDTEETTARNGHYLTYFPGKPTKDTPLERLTTTITHPDTYPLTHEHHLTNVNDTILQHITIPRLNDPRETLRLNPDADKVEFWRQDHRYMYLVDPAAALDLREYLIAGWRKGIIETFDPEYATPERLRLRPVSMYNGRWWQQLPFKIYLNPDGTAVDLAGDAKPSLIPSPQAVDACAQAMLSWNDAFDNPVIKLVDYDPTTREGEQGAFVRWGLTGNGAGLRIRGPDGSQIPGTDRSLQGIIFLNYIAEIPEHTSKVAAAHEVGHLLFGLAHRRFRGVMIGVGNNGGIAIPDPIEYAAAKANYSFPGLFDHVQGRLARVGYNPARIDDFDYPYYYPIENGIVVQRPELIDRERWYGA